MPRRLQGVIPILQTPFHEDEAIDFASLRREVDWAIAHGVDGLGTGMVSETLRLATDEERTIFESTSAYRELQAQKPA